MVELRSVRDVAEALAGPATPLLLLDVREPDERAYARIEPSLHIPMDEVADRLEEIPRDRTVVVYCHHGGRSMAVASFLESRGFERVANLEGGIAAWSREVDPRVPTY